VFLGAGSLGSTEIVLRSRNEGLSTSPQVGKGLSGNGGALSFGYDLNHIIGQVNPVEKPGPTISGMVECQDKGNWDQSFIVQDGSWPRFMDTIFRITKPILPITIPTYVSLRMTRKRITSILNPFTSALRHTQVYLALGHDRSCGSLALQDDLPLFGEHDETEAGQSLMTYRFTSIATSGKKYAMVGKKLLNASVTLSLPKTWKATTTLFLNIADANGHDIASGTLHLSLRNVIDQLRTMTTIGCSISSQRSCLISFLQTFARGILEKFLSPLAPLEYPDHFQDKKDSSGRLYKVPPKIKIELTALDGVTSTLRTGEPLESCNDSGVTGVVHDILFIPGTSVSHWFFASPFIEQNAIEYFTQKGHRCWCATPRFCKQDPDRMDTAHNWTGYDGRLDIAAALMEINRYSTQNSARSLPPYVFAHCAGSMGLASGLLDGTIHRSAISGITASQVFLHPVLHPLNELKAHLPLTRLYRMVAGDWLSLAMTKELASRDIVQSALDTLLRFYPLSDRREICSSTVCHRNNLAFGGLWSHRNINKATHDNQQCIFGGTSSTCLERLASNGTHLTLLDNDGNHLVTDENLARLRGIPIFLFSGADNNVFKPASTLKTYHFLERGGMMVRRKEFVGFGHLTA
jgi:hypothetical protein